MSFTCQPTTSVEMAEVQVFTAPPLEPDEWYFLPPQYIGGCSSNTAVVPPFFLLVGCGWTLAGDEGVFETLIQYEDATDGGKEYPSLSVSVYEAIGPFLDCNLGQKPEFTFADNVLEATC